MKIPQWLQGDTRKLKEGQSCPRCSTGYIISAWRARVCINCGLRDDDKIDKDIRQQDIVLWWLIRNLPRETDHDPLKRTIYVGSRFVGTLKVNI